MRDISMIVLLALFSLAAFVDGEMWISGAFAGVALDLVLDQLISDK